MRHLEIVINDRGFTNKPPQISIGICPTLRAQDHGNPPKVIKVEKERRDHNTVRS